MSFSVRDICDVFFTLEEKYNLNYRQIQGCCAWQLIRMHLYYDITRKTGMFGAPQQKSLSVFDKAATFLPFFKNSLFHNPFTGKYQKDILIFDHPRKVIFDGEYCDIYSKFLVDFLDEDYSFEVLESPWLNHHYTRKQDYIRYTDSVQLGSYIHKKFNRIEFTQKETELILNVQSELERAFGIKLNIPWMLKIHILNFFLLLLILFYWLNLFKNLKFLATLLLQPVKLLHLQLLVPKPDDSFQVLHLPQSRI